MEEMMEAGGGSRACAVGERKGRPQEQRNCPRCKSSNTKFCYYNNYSLTQPRYFCKSCRRYWTEGGSLRNIPVGGGSRKNRKSSVSVSSTQHAQPPAYQAHDLNLGFTAASSSVSTHLETTTTTTTTPTPPGPGPENNHGGFACYIPNLMPYPARHSAGVSMNGHEIRYGMQENSGGRFAFSFADHHHHQSSKQPQVFSGGNEIDLMSGKGQETPGGYWNGMFGGGGPW